MTPPATYQIECAVIGAGVIGLAVARALAMRGLEVVILEQAGLFGSGTSSRNSEVIHAGIYYRAGSLKAEACVRGRGLLYDYLKSYGVAHRQCGKFIVATNDAQVAELEQIRGRALENGVDDLYLIDGAAAMRAEPALRASAAIVSPSTGILDSHGYMTSLLGEAEDHGATLAYATEVLRAEPLPDGSTRLWCIAQGVPCCLEARFIVNAAGLTAPVLAARFEGLRPQAVPKAHFAKGNYFKVATRAPFARLIYPVPEPGGLGVHLTLDLGGQARFGPDVEWVEVPDYEVDIRRADKFYNAIRAYWPGLEDGALTADYAGVRPKIVARGEPDADFVISTAAEHGAEGQVHLFGIESPGLTSSLALAERVSAALS